MDNIKLIKFTSGEEIIATVVSTDEGFMTIKNGVTLVYRPHQDNGAMSVGFAPFMPYSEGNISLNHTSVSGTADVKDDLLSEYNRIFGSGIVLAQANDAAFKVK